MFNTAFIEGLRLSLGFHRDSTKVLDLGFCFGVGFDKGLQGSGL